MNFNEKLQYLRREKKLSQEQLADMLDVTRQSVSKWESGTTYPEMDKLIMLCKIFKCSLDDLTNDEITDIKIGSKKETNTNNVLNSFLGFIEKTVKMFQSMKFSSIIKCIVAMSIVALALLVLQFPYQFINNGFGDIVYNMGVNSVTNTIVAIFSAMLSIIFGAIYIMVFIYIFKVAYLDKYEFVESDKVESVHQVETSKEAVKEVKIITEVPSEKDNVIFKVFGGIILWFIKAFAICFGAPVVLALLFACFCLAIIVYLLFNGITFAGLLLLALFTILGCVWLLEVICVFVLNKKFAFKRLLITFIVSLVGIGISSGICFLEFSSIEFVDKAPEAIESSLVSEYRDYTMSDELYMSSYLNMHNINYVEDESLIDTVKVELKYYEDFATMRFIERTDCIDIERNYINDSNIFHFFMKDIKECLKDKKIYNYELLNTSTITITSSRENLDKLLKNSQNNWEEELENEFQTEIDNYEAIISEQENTIESLTEENSELSTRVQELEEYKSNVQEILNN